LHGRPAALGQGESPRSPPGTGSAEGSAACIYYRFGSAFCRRCVEVGHGNCSRTSERLGDGSADTGSGTCNQRDRPIQSEIRSVKHVFLG